MERKNKLLNPIIVWIVTVLTIGGIFIGTVLSLNNPEAQNMINETEIFSGNFYEVFKHAFFNKLLWTLVFATGGLNIFFVPLSLSGIVIKSYSYGFTSGCIISAMGTYGYFTVLSGIFLQNFLFNIAAMLYASCGINKSFECFLNRRNYECVSGKNKYFLIITCIMLMVVLIISALEGGISVLLHDV